MLKPIPEMETTPEGEDIMAGFWYSLLTYAMTRDDYTSQFRDDTGLDIASVMSARGIHAMIDESSGFRKHVLIKWADWVTLNLWGCE